MCGGPCRCRAPLSPGLTAAGRDCVLTENERHLPDTHVRAHCPGTEGLWRYSRHEIPFYSCNKPRMWQLSPLPHERNPRLREGKKRVVWDLDQPPQLHSRLPVSVAPQALATWGT